MRISTRYEFVYISTPKAGTHTIYNVLAEHFAEGLRGQGCHENQIPKEFKDYFRWTVSRNPYTRAVSLWWSACRLHTEDHYRFRARCGAPDNFTKFIVWLAGTSWEERTEEPLMQSQTQWIQPADPVITIQVHC